MFSRKKQPPIKSLIAHGTRIEGNVLFEEGIRIDGDVIGDIRAATEQPSILVISESASVTGQVQADHIIINGTVKGPVLARQMLELQPKARIEGDIEYAALEMHQGALIAAGDEQLRIPALQARPKKGSNLRLVARHLIEAQIASKQTGEIGKVGSNSSRYRHGGLQDARKNSIGEEA